MTNNMPWSGAKKRRESIEAESRRTTKTFKIVWLFHDGFHTKRQHFTLSSAPTHYFFTTLKSPEVLWTHHWWTMASFAMPFSKFTVQETKHYIPRRGISGHPINIWVLQEGTQKHAPHEYYSRMHVVIYAMTKREWPVMLTYLWLMIWCCTISEIRLGVVSTTQRLVLYCPG